MTIAFTVLLTSTLVGLATSLYFRVWTLMLVSPLIAVVAAIVLQSDGYAFATGAPIVVACLAFNQIAYLAGAVLAPDSDVSIAEEADGIPGGLREHKVHGQNEQQEAEPGRTLASQAQRDGMARDPGGAFLEHRTHCRTSQS
ncbi:hypothetical protein [Bradyrhizobium embrapense]